MLSALRAREWFRSMICPLAFVIACGAAPTTARAFDEPEYIVRTVAIGNDWQAVRMQVSTGKCWYAEAGHWKPIPEPANMVLQGPFQLTVIAMDDDWTALRLHPQTGITWRLSALRWVEMDVRE